MQLVDIGFNFTSSAFRDDEAEVVARAKKAGVTKFILTGSSAKESEYALQLTEKYEGMYSTAGVHPHLAKEWDKETIWALRKLAAHEHVVAIGETGLDYNRNYSTPSEQKLAFQAQLELAAELNMPIFLHQRDAHEDFMLLLKQFRQRLTKVVVHCFTGTEAELNHYLELDCHIGITGWICDERRGQHLHESIKLIPNNRLMIETDAPYLLPRDLPKDGTFPSVNGRRNEPAFLPHILATVAKCRGTSVEQTAEETTLTAKQFFSIN